MNFYYLLVVLLNPRNKHIARVKAQNKKPISFTLLGKRDANVLHSCTAECQQPTLALISALVSFSSLFDIQDARCPGKKTILKTFFYSKKYKQVNKTTTLWEWRLKAKVKVFFSFNTWTYFKVEYGSIKVYRESFHHESDWKTHNTLKRMKK